MHIEGETHQALSAPEVSFGSSAFVIADRASCHYEPNFNSAVRVTPPYGTEVEIVEDGNAWVLIRFCGKQAWSPRSNLSTELRPMVQPAADREPKPRLGVRYTFNSPRPAPAPERTVAVEYGPRGGRFTRNDKGYRRYF